MTLPYDYSRCQGWECDKREHCARHTSLDYKNLKPNATVMRRLCDYDIPELGQIHYIPITEVSNL